MPGAVKHLQTSIRGCSQPSPLLSSFSGFSGGLHWAWVCLFWRLPFSFFIVALGKSNGKPAGGGAARAGAQPRCSAPHGPARLFRLAGVRWFGRNGGVDPPKITPEVHGLFGQFFSLGVGYFWWTTRSLVAFVETSTEEVSQNGSVVF